MVRFGGGGRLWARGIAVMMRLSEAEAVFVQVFVAVVAVVAVGGLRVDRHKIIWRLCAPLT